MSAIDATYVKYAAAKSEYFKVNEAHQVLKKQLVPPLSVREADVLAAAGRKVDVAVAAYNAWEEALGILQQHRGCII